MKLTYRRASFLALAVTFAACCLFASVACYPGPEGPDCYSEENSLFHGARPEHDALPTRCAAFQRHELAAVDAYEQHTNIDPAAIRSGVGGLNVFVRTDVQWSEKYERSYFVDDRFPGMLLWGQTRCEREGTSIDLADDHFESGVLAHEYGHAIDGCSTSHEEQGARGYNDAVLQVTRTSLEPAALTAAEDGPLLLDGVVDLAEAQRHGDFLTGASGESL